MFSGWIVKVVSFTRKLWKAWNYTTLYGSISENNKNRSSRFRSLKRHKNFLHSFCNLPVLIFAFQSLSVFSSLQLAVALSPSHLSAFFLIEKLWKCATVKVKVWHCESESVALETKFCYSNPKALMSLILQSINFIESPALRKPCPYKVPLKSLVWQIWWNHEC